MVRPTSGGVSLLGAPVHAGAHALWARVGYLVEAPAAYAELTVRDNLEIARRLRRVADRRAVDRAIDRLGLAPYADRPAGTLSLGNAQRLGLAKALLHDPALLDPRRASQRVGPGGRGRGARAAAASSSRARGVTIFMSSHILSEVARLATRIGILHHGRLLEELDAAALDRRRGRDARRRRP